MSVIVYGPGGQKLIDPYDLHSALKEGWRLTLEEVANETLQDKKEEKEEKEESPKEERKEKPLKRLNLDALTDDEIRITAKELNIANWYNKGIERLKGEIRES